MYAVICLGSCLLCQVAFGIFEEVVKDLAGQYFLGGISSSVAVLLKTVATEKIQKDNWHHIRQCRPHLKYLPQLTFWKLNPP